MTIFYIWIVAIVITAFSMMAAKSETETKPTNVTQTPPLFERLPPKFRDADLYAINSEDHYVRIHSSAGEHMILMRLSDAQDLASPLLGIKAPSELVGRRSRSG